MRPEQYGRFLNTIFDDWVRRDVGRVCVQHFDVALASWLGQPASVCVFAPTCGSAPALEHNGDLYSCDHYVEPGYLLGNIQETSLVELMASDRQQTFGQEKRNTLPGFCHECEVRFACHGGCPKNRFFETPDGEPGLNYLCAGYKSFFKHIGQPMGIMAELLVRQKPPAQIMQILRDQDRDPLGILQSWIRRRVDTPLVAGGHSTFRAVTGFTLPALRAGR